MMQMQADETAVTTAAAAAAAAAEDEAELCCGLLTTIVGKSPYSDSKQFRVCGSELLQLLGTNTVVHNAMAVVHMQSFATFSSGAALNTQQLAMCAAVTWDMLSQHVLLRCCGWGCLHDDAQLPRDTSHKPTAATYGTSRPVGVEAAWQAVYELVYVLLLQSG
jgi:hypothetical protein